METWRMTRRIRQILPEYATALGDLAGGAACYSHPHGEGGQGEGWTTG